MLLLRFLDRGGEIEDRLLAVREIHERVVGGKERIRDAGKARRERSLHDNNRAGFIDI